MDADAEGGLESDDDAGVGPGEGGEGEAGELEETEEGAGQDGFHSRAVR